MTVLDQELSTVGGSSTAGDSSARLRAVSERERGHGRIAAWHSRGVAMDGERGRGGGGWLWGFEHAFFGALPQGRARTQRSNATPRAEQPALAAGQGGRCVSGGRFMLRRTGKPASSERAGRQSVRGGPRQLSPAPGQQFQQMCLDSQNQLISGQSDIAEYNSSNACDGGRASVSRVRDADCSADVFDVRRASGVRGAVCASCAASTARHSASVGGSPQ